MGSHDLLRIGAGGRRFGGPRLRRRRGRGFGLGDLAPVALVAELDHDAVPLQFVADFTQAALFTCRVEWFHRCPPADRSVGAPGLCPTLPSTRRPAYPAAI